MYILGVNAIGHHDASACLLKDGQIIAFAEEERFTRSKHALQQHPIHAVQFCLSKANITLDQVDYIATPWIEEEGAFTTSAGPVTDITFSLRFNKDAHQPPSFVNKLFQKKYFSFKKLPPIVHVSHHLAHAASAYRCTPFEDAAILVVDGEGDRVSTTLAYGQGNEIHLINQFPTVYSLGQMYACITNFVGLGDMAEGKTMGLAAYGNPTGSLDIITRSDQGYAIDLKVDKDIWNPREVDWLVVIDAWMKYFAQRFGEPNPPMTKFDSNTYRFLKTTTFHQKYKDIAALAQKELEDILIHISKIVLQKTGSRNLVLAGGVALNCSANGKLAQVLDLENIFIQPISSDAGAPLGACLELYAYLGNTSRASFMNTAFGPEYTDDQIKKQLDSLGILYTRCDDIATATAELLDQENVVGWFQGAMEAGPRALGHRSILAKPTTTEMRDHLNHIKGREMWRPLGPSLREENMASMFGTIHPSPFMILAYPVKDESKSKVPAVVHVDGSARPQTVNRQAEPLYWHLLDEYEKKSGLPCLINTSFNASHEPIVCTPQDALRTFYSTNLDALAIGSFLVRK